MRQSKSHRLGLVLDAVEENLLIEVTLRDGSTQHGEPIRFRSGNGGVLILELADGTNVGVNFREITGVEFINA